MKKQFFCLCALLLIWCQPALAAQAQLPVYLDGENLSAPTYVTNEQPRIFAQEKNGTAYVPLRFIAELFNADVSWQDGNITIQSGDTSFQMTIGSRQATYNNAAINISGAPYEAEGLTYVPLRFFAEAFSCIVWYHDGIVSIASTTPLQINGQTVAQLTYIDERHVMGADFYNVTGNQLITSVYNALQGLLGEETTAPDADLITSPSVANAGDYIHAEAYAFKDAQGQVIYELEFLSQLHRVPEKSGFTYTSLIHDLQTDKYYNVSNTSSSSFNAVIERVLLYKQFDYSTAP